ncbi:MAG: translocation/assembly module TamB domain-containing protein, partial [Prevotella sp.]|nr:translocation/assembly module TamB domain-containing protein [Prevotella sp.]
FGTRLYDANGDLGLRVGVNATMENDGLMFRSHLKEPTLGYRKFRVNDDNFVFLGRDNRVSADLVLKADDGTGIQIYTNDDNLEAKQDITASLNHFDLEKILSVIPYTPDIKGMMNGDFHFVQTDNQVSVSSDLDIRQFVYENTPMGDLGTEFVYMPKNDGSHVIDGILNLNGNEFATLSGTYCNKKEKTKGYLDATVDLMRMPLSILNGFIPDQIFGFEGYGEGSLSVRGPISKPVVDGEIYLDSAYMVSQPYGMRLRFGNDPVTIKGSRLLFENFEMYANNSSPLTTYGALDFTDLDHMRLDLRMRAQNFLLIDAKENSRSEAYGKAYVNYYGNINGELSNLKMRGKLDVLGSTDLVYILRDSPLTTDNHLDELVRFVDFADTTQTVVHRPDLSGFTMDMTVDISKGAHVMSYLNADKSNFIDLTGGGTLRMNYGMSKKLSLMGRYTLANGEMKYSLPIIPLKTFTIKDGSYLEFTGNPMNPTLNITATERTRAAVSSENGVGHSVDFDCGVIITKTLEDMGLEFTLDAPEDMQLHSELQAMSTEQRGKLAVTMLTTGMYLADGNTQGFSMNQALNTFLQSEINNITGNALRTLDLSVGLDNTTDASGNVSTNYSFKFAKRFWNNRLKISIGGRVSSGAEVQNRNQSFFDNVTFEYRLDDTANKYVTLFYENNVYDWLDGYTQEYGVGFIWRRSLQHFKDIFNLKSDKQQLTMPSMMRRSPTSENPSDSTLKNRQDSLIIRQDSLKNEKDSIK